MPSTELPLTVRHALGKEAAQDLMTWLEERLSTVALSPKVRVSAFIARQKVNLLTLQRVSNLFLADQPTLVKKENGNWVWLVPVDLTLPRRGRVGRVGQLEVDAYYGQVYYNQTSLDQMADEAQRLMDQLSPRYER